MNSNHQPSTIKILFITTITLLLVSILYAQLTDYERAQKTEELAIENQKQGSEWNAAILYGSAADWYKKAGKIDKTKELYEKQALYWEKRATERRSIGDYSDAYRYYRYAATSYEKADNIPKSDEMRKNSKEFESKVHGIKDTWDIKIPDWLK